MQLLAKTNMLNTKTLLAFIAIAGTVRGLTPDEEKAFCDFAKVSGCPHKAYCKSVCNYTGGWICGGYCGTGKAADHIVKIAYSNVEAVALPETFGDLLYLSELSIDGTEMYTLPDSISSLSSLSSLTIKKGSIRKLPTSFGGLRSLESLTINNCKLSVLPESFNSLSALSYLDLYGNRLAEISKTLLPSLPALSSLYLGENMLISVPNYPSSRITTNTSTYFLSNNYLATTQYGPQHSCSAYDANESVCDEILACAYDTVDFKCAAATTPNFDENDLFVYPAAPVIPNDDDGNSGSSSGSSNGDGMDEADRLLYDGETASSSVSATTIIIYIAGCIAGVVLIVLLVAFITVKVRDAREKRQRKRKSELATPEELEKQEMKERKKREKEDAKKTRKQAKEDAKKQKQEQEQLRKDRLREIELEEREAVPMSVAAYLAEAGDTVPAPDVMLLSELGAGTLGATYKAKITSHTSDGLIAAKLVSRALIADPQAFAGETRRACSISSPFLVQTFALSEPCEDDPAAAAATVGASASSGAEGEDVTTGRGNKCPRDCVMVLSEYVAAPNMRSFTWSGRSEARPLFKLKMCADIAKGLKYLHDNGVVHRDLKPENVLVVAEDPAAEVVCKVCGFTTAGLAVKDTVMDFADGMGTPQYIAPEIMSGEAEDFAQSADVFSFGVVAFEAFREEAVYSENKFESNFALMRYVLSGKRPAANGKVSQDCTTETLNLLEACWDQDPANRPELGDVIAQLENCAKNIII